MSEKILCVDDEQNILDAYQRSLRKEFRIVTAAGGLDALAAVAHKGPFAVIVSDMRMPGMDGVQFLSRVKELCPESVRVMLTGNADQQTAIEAVNEGSIFRFLNKPCPPDTLAKTLRAGIAQYRLVMAEKELLEKTLSGCVQMLTDILSLVNPTAFGRATRVRHLVRQLTELLEIENGWQTELAAMLSQIGYITIPEEILAKVYQGGVLRPDEFRLLQTHPQVGHDLIAHIPRLEEVAQIIAYQEKRYNGSGPPHDERQGEEIPLGARVIKLALDYAKLMEAKFGHAEACEEIERRGNWYDPQVVEALKTALDDDTSHQTKLVRIDELRPDMILAEDIIAVNGTLLITGGHEVTPSLRLRLKNFVDGGILHEPIKVLIPGNQETEADGDEDISDYLMDEQVA